jgi:hypothetical protein
MFQSGQLSTGLRQALTFFVFLLVAVTIVYFVWVLATEVWTGLWPGTKIFWVYDPFDREEHVHFEMEDVFQISKESNAVCSSVGQHG